MTPEERARVASGLYRSARKRGARASDLKELLRLRTGKTRTRDLSDEELLAIRGEIVRLPPIARERRVPPETPREYQRRKRKEKIG